MLANPLASRLHYLALCNYVISPSVNHLPDRKVAFPMDPSDHLTLAMLANPLASRLYYLALCNYVISPSVKYLSGGSDRSIGPSDICHACKPSCFKTLLPIAFCNYDISPCVKYLSDCKIASPMDPIDPSDICHSCKPSCFKAVLPIALCN